MKEIKTMKIIWFPFAYFSVLFLNLALLVSAVIVSIHEQSIWAGINLYILLGIFLVPCLPFACQTIRFDKQGIKKCFWFITFRKIAWGDIYRIQVHTNYDITIPYKFIYFMLKPFDSKIVQWVPATKRKYIIMVKYSDKLVNFIGYCTDKEVMGEDL
nr:hypothetical protein [uncultured Caproiciproducens sp.]